MNIGWITDRRTGGRFTRRWGIQALALLTALLGACGDDETGDGLAIVTFDVSPTTVAAGSSVRISWRVGGATRVVIATNGETLVDSRNSAGTISTPPVFASTTFVLTAFGSGGSEVSAERAVQVEAGRTAGHRRVYRERVDDHPRRIRCFDVGDARRRTRSTSPLASAHRSSGPEARAEPSTSSRPLTPTTS